MKCQPAHSYQNPPPDFKNYFINKVLWRFCLQFWKERSGFEKHDFYEMPSITANAGFEAREKDAKKGTGYNFCDTILPYHNYE